MSSLILKGDMNANIGEYLPSPYVNRIYIGEDDAGFGTVYVELNIFLPAPEGADITTLISQLEGLNFCWWVNGANIDISPLLSGDVPISMNFAYGQNLTQIFQISDIQDSDEDGIPDYETMYDEKGNRILKFVYISDPLTLASSWDPGDYDGRAPNYFYLLTWSTSETMLKDGFSLEDWYEGVNGLGDSYTLQDYETLAETYIEPHWLEAASVSVGTDVTTGTVTLDYPESGWDTLLLMETSDVGYELIIENGTIGGEEQIVYMDQDDAIYAGDALQSITSQYYQTSADEKESIVTAFQTLINDYQVQATTDSSLQNVLNGISFILETSEGAIDLLPQLNEYGKAFPSKTSATTIGQLYLQYVDKVVLSNQSLSGFPKIFKKSLSAATKVIDSRTIPLVEYVAPASVVCEKSDGDGTPIDGESCGECNYLYSTILMTRKAFPGTYYTEEGDAAEVQEDGAIYGTEIAADAWGANYGWVFFDYEKAFYNTSLLVNSFNPDILRTVFGQDLLNRSYRLKSVRLTRYLAGAEWDVDPTGGEQTATQQMYMYTDYDWDSGAPEISYMTHEYLGSDSEVGIVEMNDGRAGADSFIWLRNFDFPVDGVEVEDDVIAYGKINEYGTGASGAPGFGLMAFEFQDLMGYYEQLVDGGAGISDRELPHHHYVIEITMEDSSGDLLGGIVELLQTYKDKFEDYWESAGEPCAYSNLDGAFNNYFKEEMEVLHPDVTSAPWVEAPVVYAHYLNLTQGTFMVEGALDEDALEAYVSSISAGINPYNGSWTQVDKFWTDFNELVIGDIPVEGTVDSVYTCTYDFANLNGGNTSHDQEYVMQVVPETPPYAIAEFLIW